MKNWRMWVIGAILLAILILMMGETDNLKVLILIKLIAFALMYIVYQLHKRWKDYLPVVDEEDDL